MELIILLTKFLFTLILIYLNYQRIKKSQINPLKDILFLLSVIIAIIEIAKIGLFIKHK